MTAPTATGREEEARLALADGVRLFWEEDVLGAHARFALAHRRMPGDAQVLSWYGVTLVLVERNSNLGVALCDQALRLAGPEPELVLNLARAHLALGQRERAVRALRAGMAERPGHAALQGALDALGRRQRPILPFLSRSNPLNHLLGRLRHRWRGAASPETVTPTHLGRPSDPQHRRSDG